MRISLSTITPSGYKYLLIVFDQIGHKPFSTFGYFINHGPWRHFDHKVLTTPSKTLLTHTWSAVSSLMNPFVLEIVKGEEFIIRLKIYVSALATVTTVRSSHGNILFPSEGDATVSSFA